jgi:hypothetical protein
VYRKDGQNYSCTNFTRVKPNPTSPHLVSRGARAVDVAPINDVNGNEISWDDVYKAARLTGYNQVLNEYNEEGKHWYHLTLPWDQGSSRGNECLEPYYDFLAIEFGHNQNTRGDKYGVAYYYYYVEAVYEDGSREIVSVEPVTVVYRKE